MSTITRERVAQFIKNPLDNGLTRSEQMELARIALASLEAEPVAWRNKDSGHCGTVLIQGKSPIDCGYEPLYLAPPAPVSVPDELKEFLRLVECMLIDYRESNLGNAREWIRHISSASDAFEDAHSLSPWLWVRSARRAAMLQGADGNYPVIPDGWVACSERMPGSQEWVIVFAKWANQQVLCWDDVANRWTDFEDQSYFPDMFSHWMPLPAKPNREVL